MKRREIAERLGSLFDSYTFPSAHRGGVPSDTMFGIPVEHYAEALGVTVEPDEPPLRLTVETTTNLADESCKVTTVEGMWLKVGGAAVTFETARAVAHRMVAAYNDRAQGRAQAFPYAETAEDLEANADRLLREMPPWHAYGRPDPLRVTMETDVAAAMDAAAGEARGRFAPATLTPSRVEEIRREASGQSGNLPYAATVELVELCEAWLRERQAGQACKAAPGRVSGSPPPR